MYPKKSWQKNFIHMIMVHRLINNTYAFRGRRDCMEVGFTTTYAKSVPINIVSSNPAHGEVYLFYSIM